MLEKTLWTMLGFYGNILTNYGYKMAIKNEEVVFPAYTEEYKTFIEVMHTLYSNGYISPDHFTMDKTTMQGMTAAGNVGAASDYTMSKLYQWENWDCMPWFPIIEGDEIIISTGTSFTTARTWASASTKYPEVVALIVDHLYALEGIMNYMFGPKQGEDPLGILDGWYLDETGNVTTKQVADGVYAGFTGYCYQYVRPYDYLGANKALTSSQEAMDILGKPAAKEYKILDVVTGNEFTAYESTVYTHDTAQGHWFLCNSAVSRPHITTVNLPDVYMSEEDALLAAEILSVVKNHIESETAKFVTGIRPLSELDAFHEELKNLGIEEYIEMHKEAYQPFMDSTFG
jgi:hypothetical protein